MGPNYIPLLLLKILQLLLHAAHSITDMPYPRYGGSGQDGENYGRDQGFRGVPNPWQGPDMNSVNPVALVGNLVGAMVGQMAAGGGGGLGALVALQAGQQQVQRGWPHANADRGVRQGQVVTP